MAEKHVESYFRDKCKKAGALCMKFVSPSRRGVCDRLVLSANGMTYYVELKFGKNGLSPQQQKFKQDIENRGQTLYLIRSKEEADHFIENILF